MQIVHLDPKDVPAQMSGSYTGKKFKAIVVTEMTIPADAGLWSGGSRDVYTALHLATGDSQKSGLDNIAPWDSSRVERKVAIVPGFAVVCHRISSGVDMGLTFYIHPDNAAKLLPAPVAPLSADQQTVLNTIGGIKSSYRVAEYQRAGLTTARVDAAKGELLALGLVNAAGAITVKGRNART